MDFAIILILISAFLLIYGYVLYPFTLALLSKIFNNEISMGDSSSPEITIIISAYNEQEYIPDAIESIFKTDYPKSKINVFVGSDGSTDDTCGILQTLSDRYDSLQFFCFDRLGKNAVINSLLAKIKTEYVFFMDADIRLQNGVINKLISYLSNSTVGAVIASMESIGKGGDSAGGFGEILYQKIERKFRINESKIYSTVNALGAFYGLKSEYIEPLPDDLVADDFYPLLTVMQNRKRVLFVDEAEVLEIRPKSTSDEISRRVRASASAMTSLKHKSMLLLPSYGWVSYFLFCHKILRWLAPVFLLAILISTFFINSGNFLFVIVIIQLYIYLGALLGFILEKRNMNIIFLKLPLYALTMSIGFAGAFYRFFTGKKNSKWQRN